MSALPIIETHDAPIVSALFATSSGTGSCSKRTSSRQQKPSLPKTFLIYDIAVNMIVGACLVTSCLKGDSTSSVKWEVARACLLQEFRRIEKADCIYMSNVFQLKPACEQSIRLSRCTIGGTLNCHFIDYACDTWKVLSFDSAAIAMFRNSHGIFLVTTVSPMLASSVLYLQRKRSPHKPQLLRRLPLPCWKIVAIRFGKSFKP